MFLDSTTSPECSLHYNVAGRKIIKAIVAIADPTCYMASSEADNLFNHYVMVAFKINLSRIIPSLYSVLQSENET